MKNHIENISKVQIDYATFLIHTYLKSRMETGTETVVALVARKDRGCVPVLVTGPSGLKKLYNRDKNIL